MQNTRLLRNAISYLIVGLSIKTRWLQFENGVIFILIRAHKPSNILKLTLGGSTSILLCYSENRRPYRHFKFLTFLKRL
jgi:hypothetical protein